MEAWQCNRGEITSRTRPLERSSNTPDEELKKRGQSLLTKSIQQTDRNLSLPPARDVLMLQRLVGNGTVARIIHNTRKRIIQRHGPGVNHNRYVENDRAHLDRHLDDWQRLLGVTTKEEVSRIAQELFEETKMGAWAKQSGHSDYYVDHKYCGQIVRLVWSALGGIVTCFPKTERDDKRGKKGEVGSRSHSSSGSYESDAHSSQPRESSASRFSPYHKGHRKHGVNAPHRHQLSSQPGLPPSPYPQYPQHPPTTAVGHPSAQSDPRSASLTSNDEYQVKKGYTWHLQSGEPIRWYDPEIGQWRDRIEEGKDWWYA